MVTINHHRPVRQVSEVLCFLTNFWWWLGAVVGTQLSSGRYKSQSLSTRSRWKKQPVDRMLRGHYKVMATMSGCDSWKYSITSIRMLVPCSRILKKKNFLCNLNWNIQIWFWFLLCLKLLNIHSCGDKVLLVEIYSHTSIMLLLDWFGNPWITDLANASFRSLRFAGFSSYLVPPVHFILVWARVQIKMLWIHWYMTKCNSSRRLFHFLKARLYSFQYQVIDNNFASNGLIH